jgi:hypothetical protein
MEFDKAYRKAHPLTEVDKTYFSRKTRLRILHEMLSEAVERISKEGKTPDWKTIIAARVRESDTSIFSENKAVWLFFRDIPKDFVERSQKLIIGINDETLDIGDYALLLYVSYQDEDIKEVLNALPLPMLYEVYESVIDSTITKWEQEVASYGGRV